MKDGPAAAQPPTEEIGPARKPQPLTRHETDRQKHWSTGSIMLAPGPST